MYIPEDKPEKTKKPENSIKGHVVVPEAFVHTYMYIYIHIYIIHTDACMSADIYIYM